MFVADQLAERIVALDYTQLPEPVVHWAKVSILDTIGVALAGAGDDAPMLVRKALGSAGTGGATVLGTGEKLGAMDAAMVNGAAAHALDFDSSAASFAGHPSVHLLPAVFALAEEHHLAGTDFIAAYVAGFETQWALARLVNPSHAARGWFPTGTMGVFGATGGAARIMRLDRSRTAQALSIAAMFASGVMAHAGSMTKPLAAGNTARTGILAALLAREGLSGAPDAISDKRGFVALYSEVAAGTLLPPLDGDYGILETEYGIKQYPCCAVFHAALDVALDLAAEHEIDAGMVDRVEACLVSSRLSHVDRPMPVSGTDAKFSMQYCLARTLVSGRPDFEDFEGDAYRDPVVTELMGRVEIGVHPDMPPDLKRQDEGGAEVTIILRDGRRLGRRVAKARGWAKGFPLPRAELEAKFLACATRALPESRAREVLGELTALERVDDMSRLGGLLG